MVESDVYLDIFFSGAWAAPLCQTQRSGSWMPLGKPTQKNLKPRKQKTTDARVRSTALKPSCPLRYHRAPPSEPRVKVRIRSVWRWSLLEMNGTATPLSQTAHVWAGRLGVILWRLQRPSGQSSANSAIRPHLVCRRVSDSNYILPFRYPLARPLALPIQMSFNCHRNSACAPSPAI
jgi:hypothetical protein